MDLCLIVLVLDQTLPSASDAIPNSLVSSPRNSFQGSPSPPIPVFSPASSASLSVSSSSSSSPSVPSPLSSSHQTQLNNNTNDTVSHPPRGSLSIEGTKTGHSNGPINGGHAYSASSLPHIHSPLAVDKSNTTSHPSSHPLSTTLSTSLIPSNLSTTAPGSPLAHGHISMQSTQRPSIGSNISSSNTPDQDKLRSTPSETSMVSSLSYSSSKNTSLSSLSSTVNAGIRERDKERDKGGDEGDGLGVLQEDDDKNSKSDLHNLVF
jgi:hypothetical protein